MKTLIIYVLAAWGKVKVVDCFEHESIGHDSIVVVVIQVSSQIMSAIEMSYVYLQKAPCKLLP